MKAQTWRKFHRYLAVVIGLQLLLWTTSGLIFSWNPIKTVRGEHMIRAIESVDLKNIEFKDLNEILNSNAMIELVRCQVLSATLRTMLDQPVYELILEINEERSFALFDGVSGAKISPIGEETARKIAVLDFLAVV